MKKIKLLQLSERFKSVVSIPAWLKALGPWHSQVRLIREALGMTQQQLALRIGSRQKYLSPLENGESNPTIGSLRKVADALNCELMISFIPRQELDKMVEDIADKKAAELIRQSVANAAMELQKPSKKIIEQSKEELKNDLINNKRSLLW